MLSDITCKVGQIITLASGIQLKVNEIRGSQARFVVFAPREVPVRRAEVTLDPARTPRRRAAA
ncbi:carbon storage regulator [Halorhodospira abdelmalekii]|uniref:carbon storage regulator n=1 Tax=Halorhodospira abdelmalekii TaxID=421629 RepID=UPI001904ECFB|nr:carbon storage regulator [Halorhodospira abdelmalekii]